MKIFNLKFILLLIALLTITTNKSLASNDTNNFANNTKINITKAAVLEQMEAVTQWQLNNPTGKELWVWEYGTFYTGLMSYYKLKPQQKYLDEMIAMGESLQWKLKPHPYLADNLTIAQTYIDLYEIDPQPKYIDKARYVMDMEFYKRPSKPDLRWQDNPHKLNWWSWADSLFMAPPAFAQMTKVTGDTKYLKKMDKLWKATYKYLYDKEEDLFFRDDSYFAPRTKNDKKVFWSRGNGWVVGGLVKVLEAMPKDDTRRRFYERVLKNMSKSLIALQAPEGHWYPSLLDKDEFDVVETSGTAFFVYALAWGINNNLLDEKTYLPHVLKAWQVLDSAVEANGKLGFVQLVGVGPDKVKKEHSETYGSGAFLLAGSEVYRLLDK
ncbi:glycoside hydrolase family 88 protein [Thalassotalea fonticola]|uniref:Glycoside hydrolase family 88 protein n=1 Tax=Thalassotalea fonticola TaxID=3065649 RepID=A0ABZ0GIV7_9GAMM|nr:glycoside hydrolase family 88 protein [Colwelliaceae bacterium S1-1]